MLWGFLSARVWLPLATLRGSPVSTTHAIVGSVMGAGLAADGVGAIDWFVVWEITSSWILAPVLGGVIAAIFLAIIKTDIIYRDDEIAAAFGLELGQITLMIHSGSRGLGHQVCTDFLKDMFKAVEKYDIPLADKQLCCAPIHSDEGERYLSAMAAAANFAFMNRLVMAHWARQVFDDMFGAELRTVYDVCHNIAKREQHVVDGVSKELVVHRKGATRALPHNNDSL